MSYVDYRQAPPLQVSSSHLQLAQAPVFGDSAPLTHWAPDAAQLFRSLAVGQESLVGRRADSTSLMSRSANCGRDDESRAVGAERVIVLRKSITAAMARRRGIDWENWWECE